MNDPELVAEFLRDPPPYVGGLAHRDYLTEDYWIRMHFGRYTFYGYRGYGWQFLHDNRPLTLTVWQRFLVNRRCKRLFARARRVGPSGSIPLMNQEKNRYSEIEHLYPPRTKE